jgi:hypothetical protein
VGFVRTSRGLVEATRDFFFFFSLMGSLMTHVVHGVLSEIIF